MAFTKVFVSGSIEELEPEREIAIRSIKSLYLEPVVSDGILSLVDAAGQPNIVEEAQEADIFVLLLWQKLSSQVKREYQTAITFRKPLVVCVKMLKGNETRDQELMDFIDHLDPQAEQNSYPSVQLRAFRDFRSLADLEKTIEETITNEIHRQLKHSVITAGTRQEMYKLGTRIASASRQRLYVVQKSAILLLGAREYEAPSNQKVWYEDEYLNALDNWINSCVTDPVRQCVYLYEAEGTRKEMENYKLQELVKAKLSKYKEMEKNSGYRFRMVSITSKYPPGPMTVGDDWFAFWVMGAHDAATISFTHQQVCEEVVNVLNPLGNRAITEDNQLSELGL